MNDYGAFLKGIEGARSFVIASHFSPDGDGIGSTLALGMALERMGKRVVMYNRDRLPENLEFLPGAGRLVRELSADARFDMAIMVDCAQRKRISEEFAAHQGFGKLACIDHHKLKDLEAEITLLDDCAASTGEVVLHLMETAGIDIDVDLAQCIYTTLVVDTGFFRYSSTNAHALEIASQLVRNGASPWEVAKNLDESYPASRLRLLALSLSTLELGMEGKYATMEVTQGMLKESGAGMEYSDEFATYPRSVKGVEVAALFREVEGGVIKISLRSKDSVDVAELARPMGGGGHSRAAGLRIRGTMEQAKSKLAGAVEEALKNSKS